MDALISDLRYALRVLVKAPGFAAVAIVTLALGIGANTAIFSVVDAVLLRPLPYRDAERLVVVTTHPTGSPGDRNPTSLPDLLDWQAQGTAFAGIAAVAFNRYELNGPEGTDYARAAMGTADLFHVLQTEPAAGRTPTSADDRVAVVVLSHRIWQQRYHGDLSAIGRTVNLYDKPYTIIGVMPAGFHYPTPDIDLWTSLYPIYTSAGIPNWITTRSLHGYRAIARLKPGVTMAAAQGELNAIQGRLAQTYPNQSGGTGITLTPLTETTVSGVARALWLLLGAAGFVLLIACANIAHLLLARTTARSREIAVRQALGANRWRLARQLITEAVVLSLVGGAAGVLVAVWGTALLVRLSPGDIPRLETVAVNGWVLLFAGGASLAAGLVFGLAPAVQTWRGEVGVLTSDARGVGAHARGGSMRRALMAAEVAVALVLLMGTGLMLRSFARLIRTDPGFPADHLVTFHSVLPSSDPATQAAFADRVVQRLASLPGISAVGAATSLPPTYVQQSSGFTIDGDPPPQPGAGPSALFVPATMGYLKALGPAWVSGRDFDQRDGASAPPVVIVSRALAQQYFHGRDPLGQRITLDGQSREIIGVVGDMHYFGLRTTPGPVMFVPFAQAPFGGIWVAARTALDPASLAATLREALHGVDAGLNARGITTMENLLTDSVVQPRFQTSLLSVFGAIALLLAAVGIYGVISYGVAQRTGEIGVRLALGASTRTVLFLIVRQGMMPVLAGIGLGLAASLALTRSLQGLLFQVAPTDVLTFCAVTLVLGGVALAAAWVPARRAARVDPMVALRHE